MCIVTVYVSKLNSVTKHDIIYRMDIKLRKTTSMYTFFCVGVFVKIIMSV